MPCPSPNTLECLSVASWGYCYYFLCFDWLIDPWIGSISLWIFMLFIWTHPSSPQAHSPHTNTHMQRHKDTIIFYSESLATSKWHYSFLTAPWCTFSTMGCSHHQPTGRGRRPQGWLVRRSTGSGSGVWRPSHHVSSELPFCRFWSTSPNGHANHPVLRRWKAALPSQDKRTHNHLCNNRMNPQKEQNVVSLFIIIIIINVTITCVINAIHQLSEQASNTAVSYLWKWKWKWYLFPLWCGCGFTAPCLHTVVKWPDTHHKQPIVCSEVYNSYVCLCVISWLLTTTSVSWTSLLGVIMLKCSSALPSVFSLFCHQPWSVVWLKTLERHYTNTIRIIIIIIYY
jgi:hypothetical protein